MPKNFPDPRLFLCLGGITKVGFGGAVALCVVWDVALYGPSLSDALIVDVR